MSRRVRVAESSGNVFADLRLPNPKERLVKAGLTADIARTLRERRLTQREAAKILGIDQPKVSHLLRGNLAGFSTDRLLGFLSRLGRDVEIIIKKAPTGQGRVRVSAA